MHLIDYGHVRDGVLYHGTISDADGTPKATWTCEEDGQTVTREQPISDETFDVLWNGVAELAVFRRHAVRSLDHPIDPERFHVIGIVFQQPRQHGQYLFLVPAGETDPEFVRWLATLDVPHRRA